MVCLFILKQIQLVSLQILEPFKVKIVCWLVIIIY